MKPLLRFTVFVLTFFILFMISTVLIYWIFSIANINFAKYEWVGIVGTTIIMYFIYRKRDLSNVFNNKMIWTSIVLVVSLAFIIPDGSPKHHTEMLAYSYGFPFNFLTLYTQNGASFLWPNLFSSDINDWALTGAFLFNIIVFYLIMYVLAIGFTKIKMTYKNVNQ